MEFIKMLNQKNKTTGIKSVNFSAVQEVYVTTLFKISDFAFCEKKIKTRATKFS